MKNLEPFTPNQNHPDWLPWNNLGGSRAFYFTHYLYLRSPLPEQAHVTETQESVGDNKEKTPQIKKKKSAPHSNRHSVNESRNRSHKPDRKRSANNLCEKREWGARDRNRALTRRSEDVSNRDPKRNAPTPRRKTYASKSGHYRLRKSPRNSRRSRTPRQCRRTDSPHRREKKLPRHQ